MLRTIRQKNIEIENANQLKDEILGIVAHDLRNPLSAIESMAMMMGMDEAVKADEDARENLMVIRASCEKARWIINDLLEVARNNNTNNFGVERIELNTFLTDVVNHWQHNKAASILIFNRTDQDIYAKVNKEKIQRVMDNLISNASKFSVDGNRIEVMLSENNGQCIIEVKDSGLGIPEDMLPYVFDRFSKAGRKGVRGEDSVGMGLSIARQIINKHGGNITVQSTENMGTTFTIALPQ